ncbi:MAG: hypothetical protein JNL10_19960 [Verrucomicrobiales bacterium]|nr:hypothetical protein [Verrucomicrobiales bacterium]
MYLAKLLSGFFGGRGTSSVEPLPSRESAEPVLFGEPRRPADIRFSPGADGLKATASPRSARRIRRSWFGWLWGRNRRRDAGARMVQGELLLTQVRPVRNDFRENDDHGVRARAKVLYETPPAPERRDDQDHAWNRLRNRRTTSLVVSGE